MIEFLLKDSFVEPNCEEYDYLVKLNINNKEYTKNEILEQIEEFINSIGNYEDTVTVYLKDFLNNKNIEYEIISLRDLDTIFY